MSFYNRVALPASLLFLVLCLRFKPLAAKNNELKVLFGLKKFADDEDVYVRKRAPADAFPFYVSLKRARIDLHYCAGTLISPRFILTPASCMDPDVFGTGIANASAVVGAYDLETEADRRSTRNSKDRDVTNCEPRIAEIADVIMHKNYTNGTDGPPMYNALYDIALVKLKKPAKFNWTAIPLEIPEDCCDDVDFVNIGLGRAEEAGPYSTSLEMGIFPFMPYDECAESFEESEDEFFGKGKQNMTQEASICVRGDVADYCQLDEGSGLFRWRDDGKPPVLVGFATKATRECMYGRPYVFTNISFHMEWILSVKGVLEDITRFERRPGKCGERETTPKISTGVTAKPGQYPYVVSIRPFGKIHECNGVLISPWHVLTTGTCVDYKIYSYANQIEAYIGGIDSDPEEDDNDSEVIRALNYTFHPQFSNDTRDVNLAILTLEKASSKDPIALPFQNRDCCRRNLTLRVIGFGSRTEGEAHAKELQEGVANYVSRKDCRVRFGVQGLNRVSICAGSDETGSGAGLCKGDDGTPLIMTGGAEDVLIGLGFANTSGGCYGGRPAEFLKVAFFLKWIRGVFDKDAVSLDT